MITGASRLGDLVEIGVLDIPIARGTPRPAVYCQKAEAPILHLCVARAIHMAQPALRIDPVAHPLLQRPHVRESAVAPAIPEQFAGAFDREHAARPRRQRHFAQVLGERAQQLLRHPRRPQQPAALPAVSDDDAWRLPLFQDRIPSWPRRPERPEIILRAPTAVKPGIPNPPTRNA